MKKIILFVLLLPISQAFAIRAPASDIDAKILTNKAVISVYTYSYNNIEQRQQQTAMLFTSNGWVAFIKAFIKSGIKANVEKHRYHVTSVATAPVKIDKKVLTRGIFNWYTTMPVMVVYKNDDYQQVQYLNAHVHIVYQKGLKVQEFKISKGEPVYCKQNSKNIKVSPN